jgi:hypothetical protein
MIAIINELHQNSQQKDISHLLTRIAESLLRDYTLQAGAAIYSIVECEAYYWSAAHRDPHVYFIKSKGARYAHPQLQPAKWCLHPSGLDITIGNSASPTLEGLPSTQEDIAHSLAEANACLGGFLIRALATSDGSLINGPINCLDTLFAQGFGVQEAIPLQLKATPTPHPFRLHTSMRHNIHGTDAFAPLPYRYINAHFADQYTKHKPKGL